METEPGIRTVVERRAGQRVPAWLPITWTFPHEVQRDEGIAAGLIVDVSVSGARVVAPAAPQLTVGTRVDIELFGHHGSAVVRRHQACGLPGKLFYGVEFMHFDAGFRGVLVATISKVFRATAGAVATVDPRSS
jgi:hypothetical protein